MSLCDVVTLLKAIYEKMDKLDMRLKAIEQSIGAIPQPAPVVVRFPYNTQYKVFDLDLTTARTDEPLGITSVTGGNPVNFAIVLRCDDTAYWKRNSVQADPEELSLGYTIENYEVHELYISNPASVLVNSRLKILVEWREV